MESNPPSGVSVSRARSNSTAVTWPQLPSGSCLLRGFCDLLTLAAEHQHQQQQQEDDDDDDDCQIISSTRPMDTTPPLKEYEDEVGDEMERSLLITRNESAMRVKECRESLSEWSLFRSADPFQKDKMISAHWETRGRPTFNSVVNKSLNGYSSYYFKKDVSEMKMEFRSSPETFDMESWCSWLYSTINSELLDCILPSDLQLLWIDDRTDVFGFTTFHKKTGLAESITLSHACVLTPEKMLETLTHEMAHAVLSVLSVEVVTFPGRDDHGAPFRHCLRRINEFAGVTAELVTPPSACTYVSRCTMCRDHDEMESVDWNVVAHRMLKSPTGGVMMWCQRCRRKSQAILYKRQVKNASSEVFKGGVLNNRPIVFKTWCYRPVKRIPANVQLPSSAKHALRSLFKRVTFDQSGYQKTEELQFCSKTLTYNRMLVPPKSRCKKVMDYKPM